MLKTLNINTAARNEMKNITQQIRDIITDSGIKDGICVLFVPHTTCAVTINENADPDVKTDMLYGLGKIVPQDRNFKHMEGNSDSHIKTSMFGSSVHLIINEGKLLLGIWQGIYFCEFDGPRTRKLHVKILEG